MTEKDTENKIQQLQLMEQSLQNFLAQKQQFQSQLIELDSALNELKDSKQTYKIVGNIMVAADKDDLEKDLKSKKDIVELRIKTIEKQEEKIKEKASTMQAEVMKSMNK